MSFKCGRYYVCDICSMGTFVDDNAFAKQEPFPEGWVRLTSQLRTFGEYRSACVAGAIEAERKDTSNTLTLNLDICDCCWENQTVDIAALYRKRKEKECNTLH